VIKISVASGKGGTGKTTIATIMAVTLAKQGKDVTYMDCDVEEPNGHIFIKPKIEKSDIVSIPIPEVDLEKCTFCGKCSEVCEYNAIAVLTNNVMVFPSLCHGCGGCYHICPEKAITEIPRQIGFIRSGSGNGVKFMDGNLRVGEALSPPITKELKKKSPETEVLLIDAPPGTSCPVIEAISDTDYVILVTEPTPFGLNDLKLSVEMLRLLQIPFGVIINRSDIGNGLTESYCDEGKIDILMRIPFDRKMAEAYSRGDISFGAGSDFEDELYSVYEQIAGQVQNA